MLTYGYFILCDDFNLHKTVTDDPGSKPDQKYARRSDKQNYIGKNKLKFRTSSKRISLVCNILVHCEGVDFKGTGINYFHFSVQKYVYINGQLIALFIIFFNISHIVFHI